MVFCKSRSIGSALVCLYHFKEQAARDVLLLGARLSLAWIFFRSGLTKIEDMETTILLFSDVYSVPLLSPFIAALSATFFELCCSVFLVLGLGARVSALVLLVMTIVIQYTFESHVQHAFWALGFTAICLAGPGRLSLEALCCRMCSRIKRTPAEIV